jgi:hypothetical protein
MATYYWVGGTGTWDNSATANWSLSSGGAGGSGPPLSTDNVIFDSSSGTGTCTTGTGATCQVITLNTSTLALKLGANTTATATFNFTLGSLDLDNNKFTIQTMNSSNTNVRSIAFGTSGSMDVTGSGVTIWGMATTTNLSITGTPQVNLTYSGGVGTRVVTHGATGGSSAIAVSFSTTAGTDTITFSSPIFIVNHVFTGFSGTLSNRSANIYGNLVISSTMTVQTGGNTLSFLATSGTQQITTNGKSLDYVITQNSPGATVQLQDNLTMGSTRTFTLTAGTLDLSNGNRTLSTGIFSSNNSNTRSIAFGTGNITLTQNAASIYNTSTGTNLTFTGTPVVNLTYSGSTGTRTITSATNAGAFTSFPTFNVSAGSDIVSFANTGSTGCLSLNFTGFTGTCSSLPRSFVNNLTLVSGMTLTNTGTIAFVGTSGTQQVTSAGLTLDCAINFTGVGGTVAFQDALTQGSTRNFTITNGIIQLKNGVTSTVGNFLTSGTNQKFLQSTTPGSQATLSEAAGTVDASYLTIRDINATGGATWNAFVNQQNVDAGNNDGWDFGISPIVGSYEYTYQLRSFTQPRRF